VAPPIRVAVTIDPAHQGVDPQVAEAGYAVEEMEPPSLLRGLELFLQLSRTYRQLQASPIRLETLAEAGLRSFLDQLLLKFRQRREDVERVNLPPVEVVSLSS
jgi:hypothetical protein